MKIIVREDRQITIRAVVPVDIKDAGSELEKVAVRLLRRPGTVAKRKAPNTDTRMALKNREVVWERIFSRLLAHTTVAQSLPRPEPTKTRLLVEHPKTKIIEIRLTLPAIPKVRSWADVKQLFANARRKQIGISRRTRVIGALAGALVVVFCYHVLAANHPTPVPASSTSPRKTSMTPGLVKGTPDYATILPTGQSIQNLGGWTRVSPSGKNAVYAYADKIGDIPINVSEQPLPPGFQTSTQERVAELAQSFKATEKIPAAGTDIYIATFADESQSVILSKNHLLVLMKSTALLPPTKWVAYVNSLQ